MDHQNEQATGIPLSGLPPTPLSTSPLVDAVNNAVESSSKIAAIDPDLVNVVTEQVLKQLQSQYHLGPAPFGSFPVQNVPQTPQSPDFSSVASFPPRYTPSSSRRESDRSDANDQPLSPGHRPSIPRIDRNKNSSNARDDQGLPQDNDYAPRASEIRNQSVNNPVGCSGQRRDRSVSEVRATDNPRPRDNGGEHSSTPEPISTRTEPSEVTQVADEVTALEKAWQPMFGKDGRATARLGQLLRGLANCLIQDYEPKNSLVVTPAKMLRFFQETGVPGEIYPWSTIFGAMKHPSLSIMYRKLLCHHHLVQDQPYDQPSVPGLTPTGFETMMTCLIQAHPEIEFQRLARAVRNMPVSNADDSRERFPKELPRRLFPARGQVQAEQKLISSLNHEISLITLDRAATTMPPPPMGPPPQYNTSIPATDRELTESPHSLHDPAAVNPSDDSPPAIQIERQRKPYFAKERSGKFYDVGIDGTREEDSDRTRDVASMYNDQYSNSPPKRPSQSTPGLTRSTSYKSSGRHYSFNNPTPDVHRKPTNPPVSSEYNGRHRRDSTPPRYQYPRGDQGGMASSAATNEPRRYTDGRPLERARTTGDDDRSRSKTSRNTAHGSL